MNDIPTSDKIKSNCMEMFTSDINQRLFKWTIECQKTELVLSCNVTKCKIYCELLQSAGWLFFTQPDLVNHQTIFVGKLKDQQEKSLAKPLLSNSEIYTPFDINQFWIESVRKCVLCHMDCKKWQEELFLAKRNVIVLPDQQAVAIAFHWLELAGYNLKSKIFQNKKKEKKKVFEILQLIKKKKKNTSIKTKKKMLKFKTLLYCVAFAFFIFIILQICELNCRFNLLEECIAETVTSTEVKELLKQVISNKNGNN